MKQPLSCLVSQNRGRLYRLDEASIVTMLLNSEALGNLCGEGVHISWGQLFKSVHLQARRSISELVANTWNMLSFENNTVM